MVDKTKPQKLAILLTSTIVQMINMMYQTRHGQQFLDELRDRLSSVKLVEIDGKREFR